MKMANIVGRIGRGMPFEEYEVHEGVNASLLKVVHDKSLRQAKYMIEGNKREDKPELSFGRAFHGLVLEGKREFVVPEDTYQSSDGTTKPWNWNANTCKDWRSRQTLPILDKKTASLLDKMVESVEIKPAAGCQDVELCIFSERNGIPLKARIDWLTDTAVVDFKTVASANPESFIKMAYSYGYLLQGAFYLDMLKWSGIVRNEFKLIAIEKEPPFASCALSLKQDECGLNLIDLGRKQYQRAFDKLEKAIKSNYWPGYGEHEAETVAPIWMAKELEQLA